MDVDGAIPDCEGHEMVPPFKAGCVWSREDYSCSYDAVFMAFFALYSRSPHSWRDDWRRQSPEWTMPLADSFDFLKALDFPEHTPEELSISFSHLRDRFRNQLSSLDQQAFPRRGQELAPVRRILELLFGSIHGPCIKRHLSCTGCGAISQTSHNFPFLALPFFPVHHLETDPQFVPSETLLARFIDTLSNPSRSCSVCHGSTQVGSLTMSNHPWIWFETKGDDTMSPSPTVQIELSGGCLIYDLHSIIYLGADHFTARVQDSSNGWWNYDGMWEYGVPRRDHVQITADLLYNGRRRANFLIYSRRNN